MREKRAPCPRHANVSWNRKFMNRLSIWFAKRSNAFGAIGLSGLLLVGAGAVGRAADEPLSPELVTKITALLVDKQTRTPAQNKLSSELLYAIRMARGEDVAPGVPTQRLSFAADANGRVLVDIKANVTDALLAQIRQGG